MVVIGGADMDDTDQPEGRKMGIGGLELSGTGLEEDGSVRLMEGSEIRIGSTWGLTGWGEGWNRSFSGMETEIPC